MSTSYTPVDDGQNTLVLLLHAYAHHANDLVSVEEAIREVWPNATIHRPEFPASLFSMEDPNRIVVKLIADIDRITNEASDGAYERIVLIGHSLGALLARKLYLVACGEVPEAPFEDAFHEPSPPASASPAMPRPWAFKVSRIILLAGMNRGWRVSHHLNLGHAPLWWLGAIYCHIARLISGRWPLIFTIHRGAEFITQLRIQWILMRRRVSLDRAPEGSSSWPGGALTIQLLGSRDDMVAPEDNVDLVSGGDFLYFDVPYSGHADVIRMDDCVHGQGRKRVFLGALLSAQAELESRAVVPSDENFVTPEREVRKVIFVMHGIRDAGYWTHKIARRVKERARDGPAAWATETSTYGYFPMLPFLFPWPRRQKVEWFMDQYTEALARYPEASFSYIGHSNGTYLLAKALELYPCCHFQNVVFAGSVVYCQYNWQRFLNAKPPRLKAVLNFVATSDWVVAGFPKLFQVLRLQDLGSAGHDGFEFIDPSSGVHQAKYVQGGHGAAISEPIWDAIADFINTGEIDPEEIPQTRTSRAWWVTLLGKLPIIIWVVLIGAGATIWCAMMYLINAVISDPLWQAYGRSFATAAYLVLLWLVLTRV